MSALTKHMQKYPRCRSTTLSYLIERDRITEQLRREVAAQKRRRLVARFLSIFAMKGVR
jgi:hypothetical protein